MIKKSLIEREKKRIELYNKYNLKRNYLLQKYNLSNNTSNKIKLHFQIQKLPRNSSKTRIRNRCWKTGRSRGILRNFGLSRHTVRSMAHKGLIPGLIKSSW